MDETMRISFSKEMRIQTMVEGMQLEHKTRFAGYIVDYIENNLSRYAATSETKPTLFDRPREAKTDRELKFKLI